MNSELPTLFVEQQSDGTLVMLVEEPDGRLHWMSPPSTGVRFVRGHFDYCGPLQEIRFVADGPDEAGEQGFVITGVALGSDGQLRRKPLH